VHKNATPAIAITGFEYSTDADKASTMTVLQMEFCFYRKTITCSCMTLCRDMRETLLAYDESELAEHTRTVVSDRFDRNVAAVLLVLDSGDVG